MDNQAAKSQLPFKHSDITSSILGAFYSVYNYLGYGFLEKVYANSLRLELGSRGMMVEQEKSIQVQYRGQVVGEYAADLVVADCVIVEDKAVKALLPEHEAQLLNYLKATPYEVGLLLNFGPKAEKLRRSFENTRKEWMQLEIHP